MGERRFVIAEDVDGEFSFSITETELKRRLLGVHISYNEGYGDEDRINILLYGEEQQARAVSP